MRKGITLYDKNNKEVKCDVLIEFTFAGENYIVYTDNTLNKNLEYNLYKAKIDSKNKLSDPIDIDVEPVFDKLIEDYKNRIIRGDNNV